MKHSKEKRDFTSVNQQSVVYINHVKKQKQNTNVAYVSTEHLQIHFVGINHICVHTVSERSGSQMSWTEN